MAENGVVQPAQHRPGIILSTRKLGISNRYVLDNDGDEEMSRYREEGRVYCSTISPGLA